MKTVKFIIFLLVILIVEIGIFLLGASFGKFTVFRNNNGDLETAEIEKMFGNYTRFVTQDYHDSKGRNFVIGIIQKNDNQWSLTIKIEGEDGNIELFNKEIWVDENKLTSEYELYYFNGAWDKNDKYLAVVWQDLGWVWDVSDIRNPIIVRKLDVLREDHVSYVNYVDGVFFVGDKADIYVNFDRGLYKIGEEIELVVDQGDAFKALETGDGFSYWKEAKDGYGYPNILAVWRNNKETVYDLGFDMDVASGQIFSPDRKKLCTNVGSSGYWGYSVWNLETKTNYVTGNQYSYCLKWLDNFRVLIKVNPYHYQYVYQYFIYDTRVDKMSFMYADESELDWLDNY